MGSTGKGASFWQHRYVLRHYRDCDDATLAAGSGLSQRYVADYLALQGATRSAGDLKRIEKRGRVAPPELFSPAAARRALTKLQSRPLGGSDYALMLVCFAGSLWLYAATCARTVTGEDGGEFLAAAHGFGVPHPPGYPLWLVLAWTADHVAPWVSAAWRVSMVSALFSAASNALLLAILLKTVRSHLAACGAAALFAVSLTHWTQAVIPEVYGLNTFFVALQLLLLIRLAERPTAGRLAALAAVTGLSATNHTSALPMAIVLALGAVLVAPDLFRRPGVIAGSILAGLLPLVLYLALPWASSHEPYVDWGRPRTAEALWEHVTRAQYRAVEGTVETGNYTDHLRRLQILGDSASRQFASGWVLVLAAVGAVGLLFRQTGVWLAAIAVGWFNSVGVTRYTSFSFEREHVYANQIFWIPAWLVLAWLIGGGLDEVVRWLERIPSAVARRSTIALAGAACVLLVASPAQSHFAKADRSQTTLIEGFSRSILDVMDQGALYFPSSDHSTFGVLYQQGVAGHRLDVTVADKTGEIEPHLVESVLTAEDRVLLGDTPRERYRATAERLLIQRWPGPIYFANRRDMKDLPGRVLEPVGAVFKVMTADEAEKWWAPQGEGSPAPGITLWDALDPLLAFDARQRLDITVQMVQGDLLYMKGFALIRAGDGDSALATWNRIEGDLAPLKQQFNNIGSALAENGHPTEALTFYERAVAEDPRYLTGLRNKALVLGSLGQSDEMIETLRQAIDVDPAQRDVRLELARKLAEVQRPIEALAEYEALAMLDRRDPLPFREAGKLMLDLGDTAKAKTLLNRALELHPEDAEVAGWLDAASQGQPLAMDPDLPKPGAPMSGADWFPDEAFSQQGLGGPKLPNMPRDPALGLGFDPMPGVGRGRLPTGPQAAPHRPGGSLPR